MPNSEKLYQKMPKANPSHIGRSILLALGFVLFASLFVSTLGLRYPGSEEKTLKIPENFNKLWKDLKEQLKEHYKKMILKRMYEFTPLYHYMNYEVEVEKIANPLGIPYLFLRCKETQQKPGSTQKFHSKLLAVVGLVASGSKIYEEVTYITNKAATYDVVTEKALRFIQTFGIGFYPTDSALLLQNAEYQMKMKQRIPNSLKDFKTRTEIISTIFANQPYKPSPDDIQILFASVVSGDNTAYFICKISNAMMITQPSYFLIKYNDQTTKFQLTRLTFSTLTFHRSGTESIESFFNVPYENIMFSNELSKEAQPLYDACIPPASRSSLWHSTAQQLSEIIDDDVSSGIVSYGVKMEQNQVMEIYVVLNVQQLKDVPDTVIYYYVKCQKMSNSWKVVRSLEIFQSAAETQDVILLCHIKEAPVTL